VGFGAVAIAGAFALVKGRALSGHCLRFERVMLVGILLYVAAFVRLPLEAGYLIPTVPLALIVLGLRLPHRGFVALCLALLVSPFFLSIEADSVLPPRVRDPAVRLQISNAQMRLIPYGPLLIEHVRSKTQSDHLQRLATAVEAVPRPALLLAGEQWAKLTVTLGEQAEGLVIVDSLGALSEGRAQDPLSRTWPPPDSTRHLPIYVLPGVPLPDADDSHLRGRVPYAVSWN
jgi:hypothetical protein